MVYKRYVSPFEQQIPSKPCPPPPPPCPPKAECTPQCNQNKFLGAFDCDTVLILGILALLILDDNGEKDIPLIIALVFLLLNA